MQEHQSKDQQHAGHGLSESAESVGQFRTPPTFQLKASPMPGNQVAQRAEATPAEVMGQALTSFNAGRSTMLDLARACVPYAGTHGAEVQRIMDQLGFTSRDNLAYAMANQVSFAVLKTFDKALMERMISELSGTLNTTSWDANAAMAERVQSAIDGAASDRAAQEARDAQDRARRAAEDAAFAALMAKPRLTTEEIATARVRIDAMPDGPAKVALYTQLQEKVQYINQRNVGTYAGENAGGGSCNLTSLAMCMSYLGLGIPDTYKTMPGFPTTNIVEQLEFIRRTENLGARTTMAGWGGVATAVGAVKTDLVFDQVKNRAWWESNVRDAHLNAGHAVMTSIHGHIIRIQAVTEAGVVVDDPYGASKLKAGQSRGWDGKNDSSRADLQGSNKGVGETVGEDHVWPWADVEIHNFHWIVAFARA